MADIQSHLTVLAMMGTPEAALQIIGPNLIKAMGTSPYAGIEGLPKPGQLLDTPAGQFVPDISNNSGRSL